MANNDKITSENAEYDIECILKMMSNEQPVFWTFFHSDIEEKITGNWLGAFAGAAIFGFVGSVVGSKLMESYACRGSLGILVATENKIFVGTTPAPFKSAHAAISPEHLTLLRTQIDVGAIERKTFDISFLRIALDDFDDTFLKISCDKDTFKFRTSDLFINGHLYEHPTLLNTQETLDHLLSMGTMPYPDQFVTKLLEKQSPISEKQFNEILEVSGNRAESYVNDSTFWVNFP